MKSVKNLLIILLLSTPVLAQAQEPDTETKLTRDDKKEIRKQQWKDFEAGLKNFFDHPEAGGWYVHYGVGYGIPFLTIPLNSPMEYVGDSDYQQTGTMVTEKSIISTNGGGPTVDIAVGKQFNPYLSFDLNISFHYYPTQLDARVNTPTYKSEQKTTNILFGMTPKLTLNSGNMNNFYLYASVGPFIPFAGIAKTEASIEDKELRVLLGTYGISGLEALTGPIANLVGATIKVNAEAYTKFNPTIGISAAAGVRYQINDRWSAFGEMGVTAYTIKPRETNYEVFNMNVDVLGFNLISWNKENAPKYLTKTIYKDVITNESNQARLNRSIDILNPNNEGANKPQEDLTFKKNATTLYFKVGANFHIPKRYKAEKLKAEEEKGL